MLRHRFLLVLLALVAQPVLAQQASPARGASAAGSTAAAAPWEGCGQLKQVMKAARQEFVSLRGRPRPLPIEVDPESAEVWTATLKLPGFPRCEIYNSREFGLYYLCTRIMDSCHDAVARFLKLNEPIRACLPDWSWQETTSKTYSGVLRLGTSRQGMRLTFLAGRSHVGCEVSFTVELTSTN